MTSSNAQTLETINMMMRQEEGRYQRVNWVRSSPTITASDRNSIASWYFQLADYLGLSHETLEIALSLLDRYSQTQTIISKEDFQAAGLVCLYISVKCHEVEVMDPELTVELSRGQVTAEQVEELEVKILSATQWAVNAPTAVAYVRQLLDLLPSSVPRKTEILKFCQLQIDASMLESKFLNLDCADIAYCAVANAVQFILVHNSPLVVARLQKILANALLVDVEGVSAYKQLLRNSLPCLEAPPTKRRPLSPRSVVVVSGMRT